MIKQKTDLKKDVNESGDLVIPEELPLLAARDVVIFSNMILPLFIGRETSILAVEEAMTKNRLLMLATQKDQALNEPTPSDIYEVGTVGMIMRVLKLPDNRLKVLIQGLTRARVKKYIQTEPFSKVSIQRLPEKAEPKMTLEVEALMRNVREQSEQILSLKGLLSSEVESILNNVESAGRLADLIASNLRLKVEAAQGILEIIDPIERLNRVNGLLRKELEVSTMQAKIQSEAQEEMSQSQREYYLREQIRAIKRELGDTDDRMEEVIEYRNKIAQAKMPEEAKKEALKQLSRMEQMHRDSAEASIVRTYLDWLVEVPWSKSTRDKLDIIKAKEILDEDHYGLEKVKDRILEYLAVRKLNKKMKGPILCFIGPPGVGKTSLGQSIARSMGRKFTRLSLGGMRDEAEIRGHRRTYIGAMPGRIIQGLKNVGTNNPIFMLDEVDKIGNDFRGDPSAALLEVLDPEQNDSFSDHYLNLPFDLSKVMFITTANVIDPVPPALEDRMEKIQLSGYTEDEKLAIAQNYLLPRQLTENGLNKKHLLLSDGALVKIINQYTEEAGLRNLERRLGSICRKVARRIAEGERGPFKITGTNLHRYLGVPEFLPEPGQEKGETGVATGMAWTQAGGELLYIEVTTMPGKGNLTLTGQLGEVMKESAQAALSLARSRAKKLKLDPEFYENLDIHVHVPAGAIPKDGPSAGVTMTAALISALTKMPVPNDTAMTGEITLRGKILPIGGLKEKSLAAHRTDYIKRIIIPEQNRKDLAELPAKIKRKLKFHMVKDVDQFLDLVFPAPVKKESGAKSSRKRTRKPKAAA
ncbi:MAG: endopeptidase La [Deltaproteobacteria bacterium]|nr:endopeptidase La [Deltaproteobacteria bacterium]MBW2050995.1 endopeptidase La [Deltaproteobacteria bacterium]